MPLTLEQLLRVPHVDAGYGFDLSPDGTRLAFSWNRSGSWEIYELPLPGAGEAKPITRAAGGKFHPQYAPDGKRIAYALALDGSESYHIAVFHRISGMNIDLTPNSAFAHQPNISWSPDGKQLAVLSDAAGH